MLSFLFLLFFFWSTSNRLCKIFSEARKNWQIYKYATEKSIVFHEKDQFSKLITNYLSGEEFQYFTIPLTLTAITVLYVFISFINHLVRHCDTKIRDPLKTEKMSLSESNLLDNTQNDLFNLYDCVRRPVKMKY